MRKATLADANRIIEFLFAYFMEYHKTKPLKVGFDIPQTRAFIEQCLKNDNVICYISEEGVILGEVCYTWFGPNLWAKGFLWYVRPESRGRWSAWRLIKAFDKEAKERGASYSLQELHNPTHKTVAEGLFHKANYKDYSASYMKEL